MAETPPQGSLLSNFIFGGDRKRPAPGVPRYSGSSSGGRPQLSSEQIAENTAFSLSDPARQAAEAFLISFKSELSGKKVLKQFGGEDEIVGMDHEVVSKAIRQHSGEQSLQDLGIASRSDFKKHYLEWRSAQQDIANKEMSRLFGELKGNQITKDDYQRALRKLQGEGLGNIKGLAADGLGKYQFEYDKLSLVHPLRLVESIGKNITAREAQLLLSRVNPISGEYSNVPYFNKFVESQLLAQFIGDRLSASYEEIQNRVSTKTSSDPSYIALAGRFKTLEQIAKNTPQAKRNKSSYRDLQRELAVVNGQIKDYWAAQNQKLDRLKALQEQEEKDAAEPVEANRTGLKSYVEKRVKAELRNKVLDAFSRYSKEFRQVRAALSNPLRHFIWSRGYFFGKERGLNLNSRFLKLTNSFWSKIPLGKYLRLGVNGIFRKGASVLGKRAGALFKKLLGSLVRSSITSVARAVVTAVISAVISGFTAVTSTVIAALGVSMGVIGVVVVLITVVILVVLAPFSSQRLAAAATIPPGLLPIKSQILLNFFNDAATQSCVPPAMLLAIARREAGGTFDFTDADVTKFSTPNWWIGAPESELRRGYCYNTCSDPSLQCTPGSDVQGAMQFEAGTFVGYANQVTTQVGHAANRCNIQDSIYAAALKIKANSGTGASDCSGWSDVTVHQVAERYCGSCDSVACGGNYCDSVLRFYKSYIALGGGNTAILQSLITTSKLEGGWCGAYVDNVLANAGLPRIGSAYAVDFYTDAPQKGYSVFPGYSVEPRPGDVVIFKTDEDLLGRPGHVDIVAAVDSNYVYLTGNDYDLMPYRRSGNTFSPPPGADSTHLSQVGIIRAGVK